MKNHGNKLGVISAMALVAALPGRKLTKEFLEGEIELAEYKRLSERLTHCTITTKSGFVFTGESACVDPTNYDEYIGNKIAYDNAFGKMWMPYGFWLHKALADHDNRLQPPSDDNKIEAQDITKGVSFGHAVELLKAGHRVAREGWNGKGMFLYYVPENKYPASRNEHGTMVGVFEDDMVPYGAYIAMKTAQNNVVPWLASQTDLLSEDWQIVE